jgi:hypothetical protein
MASRLEYTWYKRKQMSEQIIRTERKTRLHIFAERGKKEYYVRSNQGSGHRNGDEKENRSRNVHANETGGKGSNIEARHSSVTFLPGPRSSGRRDGTSDMGGEPIEAFTWKVLTFRRDDEGSKAPQKESKSFFEP